jgi:hypothetical protein
LRKIIFHYHLFKNAGTSVDELLKANFPNRWLTREFNGSHGANIAQVAQWLQEEPSAVAFSSHTALLPPPSLDDTELFPVLFVRHPIDRIASAYEFERKQDSNNVGAVVARQTSLTGYIEFHLSQGHSHSQCQNFQIDRFAHFLKGTTGSQSALGLQALDALPFVGLVEEFEQSINRLATWLTPHFPGFKPVLAAKNVSRDRSLPLELKLEGIRAEIGSACYDSLLEANAGDMALFEAVRKRYA